MFQEYRLCKLVYKFPLHLMILDERKINRNDAFSSAPGKDHWEQVFLVW